MENPFKNDEKFKSFANKNNCKYAIVYYDWDYDHSKDSFVIIGFEDYKTAFDSVTQISDSVVGVLN